MLLLLTGSTPVCQGPFLDLFGVHAQKWGFCVLFLLVCRRICSILLPDSEGVGFLLCPGSVLCLGGLSRCNMVSYKLNAINMFKKNEATARSCVIYILNYTPATISSRRQRTCPGSPTVEQIFAPPSAPTTQSDATSEWRFDCANSTPK